MAVYRDIRDVKSEQTVVTVGSFDGVHCGHRLLLQRVVGLAEQHRIRSVALTFFPHPRQILDPDSATPLLLHTPDEKIALLEQTGVDDIVILPFDRALSQMSACDFIRELIIGKMNARYLVMGQDHHFGKNRGGDVQHLQELVAQSDLQVEIVDLKMLDRKISSSAIREALLCGDLNLANEMLGYEYIISGKVIHGNQLGRTIGFPTANIETPDFKVLPKKGVYRVKVNTEINHQKSNVKYREYEHLGMMYIGNRPVLKQKDAKLSAEVHIFNFDQQIYGQEITVALTHRIRDDIRFENFTQLTEQLHCDKQKILNVYFDISTIDLSRWVIDGKSVSKPDTNCPKTDSF